MALYIPHSVFHLVRLLYVRPETFGPYYVNRAKESHKNMTLCLFFYLYSPELLRIVLWYKIPRRSALSIAIETTDRHVYHLLYRIWHKLQHSPAWYVLLWKVDYDDESHGEVTCRGRGETAGTSARTPAGRGARCAQPIMARHYLTSSKS